MPVNLLQPVLNTRRTSIHFFNGRLLSGEDLTAEQKANRAAHNLLGQGIGSGVVSGLEVHESAASSTTQTPVVTVKAGLAINRSGATLLLTDATDVSLVRPTTAPTGNTTFQDCDPVQSGAYVAGAGVYLLTIGPASATQGLAEVFGVNTANAPCNTKYNVDGVQFRLIATSFSLAELSDINHLRNLAAYRCFGIDFWDSLRTDPFGATPATFGLVDQLRQNQQLTDCEVPLAILFWTATGGLVFIDMWSVRRTPTEKDASTRWPLAVNQRPIAEAEAMFLQFQSHIEALRNNQAAPQLIRASDYFRYLPAAGVLPAASSAPGFDYMQFFPAAMIRPPVFVDGARLETMLRQSLTYRPIDLTSGELIRLYLVRENRQAIASLGAAGPQPYIVFVTGHAPYYGDAHYNVARWDYSNYF